MPGDSTAGSKFDKAKEALGFRRESIVERSRLQDGGDFKLKSPKDAIAE